MRLKGRNALQAIGAMVKHAPFACANTRMSSDAAIFLAKASDATICLAKASDATICLAKASDAAICLAKASDATICLAKASDATFCLANLAKDKAKARVREKAKG